MKINTLMEEDGATVSGLSRSRWLLLGEVGWLMPGVYASAAAAAKRPARSAVSVHPARFTAKKHLPLYQFNGWIDFL